ncbi:MAG: cupin domain-containing protein [Acidimicrobiales bacterium]
MTFPARITRLPAFAGPFDAHRLAAEGAQILFASYPAGTVIGDHAHATHNVGVITSGELIVTVDGVETRHGPGSWYEVRPDVVHRARFEVETAEIEIWFDVDAGAT